MRITMVHANHVADQQTDATMRTYMTGAKKPSFIANSGKSSSQSSTSSALSFSGGAAAGWVIQIGNEGDAGPTIYHTGDTNVFTDMGLIDELYKPTHVLMPIGEQCTLGAFDAAYVCK